MNIFFNFCKINAEISGFFLTKIISIIAFKTLMELKKYSAYVMQPSLFWFKTVKT